MARPQAKLVRPATRRAARYIYAFGAAGRALDAGPSVNFLVPALSLVQARAVFRPPGPNAGDFFGQD